MTNIFSSQAHAVPYWFTAWLDRHRIRPQTKCTGFLPTEQGRQPCHQLPSDRQAGQPETWAQIHPSIVQVFLPLQLRGGQETGSLNYATFKVLGFIRQARISTALRWCWGPNRWCLCSSSLVSIHCKVLDQTHHQNQQFCASS